MYCILQNVADIGNGLTYIFVPGQQWNWKVKSSINPNEKINTKFFRCATAR